MVLAAVGLVLLVIGFDAEVPDNWGSRGFFTASTPIGATAGLLIALRQPRNPIGWILLVGAVSGGFSGAVQEYVTYSHFLGSAELPGVTALAWVASWSWALFAGPMLMVVPVVFPTGTPLSPRWTPVIWAGVLFVPAALVVFGLRPGPLENDQSIDNPLALSGTAEQIRGIMLNVIGLGMGASALAAGTSLVMRYRRASGLERQQLKWMALSGALVAMAFASIILTGQSKPSQLAMVAAFWTMPVAISIAILRYRLYDIDLIINRAIVYGALSAVLAASYFALVVLSQAALRPFTGGSEIAVAASTLAVVALVQPLRRRIQTVVDSRFYRSRYDAARTLDAFATRLRDEVDLDAVRLDLARVIDESIRPAHASVWLREVQR